MKRIFIAAILLVLVCSVSVGTVGASYPCNWSPVVGYFSGPPPWNFTTTATLPFDPTWNLSQANAYATARCAADGYTYIYPAPPVALQWYNYNGNQLGYRNCYNTGNWQICAVDPVRVPNTGSNNDTRYATYALVCQGGQWSGGGAWYRSDTPTSECTAGSLPDPIVLFHSIPNGSFTLPVLVNNYDDSAWGPTSWNWFTKANGSSSWTSRSTSKNWATTLTGADSGIYDVRLNATRSSDGKTGYLDKMAYWTAVNSTGYWYPVTIVDAATDIVIPNSVLISGLSGGNMYTQSSAYGTFTVGGTGSTGDTAIVNGNILTADGSATGYINGSISWTASADNDQTPMSISCLPYSYIPISGEGTAYITVYNFVTNAAISGASVKMSALGNVTTRITGSSGSVVFPNLTGGVTYNVIVSADGYAEVSNDYMIDDGTPTEISIWMTPYGGTDPTKVYISGTVRNAQTGETITNANIAVSQSGDPVTYSDTSDYSGTYGFTHGFDTGSSILFNSTASGYYQSLNTFTPITAGNLRVNITLMPTTLIDSTGSIVGIAQDYPYKNPVAGATIYYSNGTYSSTKTTNGAGYYNITGLRTGEVFTIYGTAAGYAQTASEAVTVSATETTIHYVTFYQNFTVQVVLKDIADYSVITNGSVTATGSATGTKSTSGGYANFTSAYGTMTITAEADGYYGTSTAVSVDSDRTVTLYLTKKTDPQPSTWYSPFQIQLKIMDLYSNPIPGAWVSINYISSSLPSPDTDWLTRTYGVDASVAAQMVNSSVFEQDYTGTDGAMTFTGFSSIRYNINITNATAGIDHNVKIMPKDSMYMIYVSLPGQVAPNNTLAAVNASLPWWVINSTAYKFGLSYQDTQGCTSNVLFNVTYRNGTVIYSHNNAGFNTNLLLDNYTMISPGLGTEILWRYNATKVC